MDTFIRLFLVAVMYLGIADLALAHPHIWITNSETILFTPDGKLSGIQHQWAFDESYSEYAVQGLERDKDGRIGKEVLAPLAKSNTNDLAEFQYFTKAKSDGKPLTFGEPKDYSLEFDGGLLIYKFTLPLKEPIKPGHINIFEITDPSYYIAFVSANKAANSTDSNGGQACSIIAKRPPEDPQPTGQSLNESMFNDLNTNGSYGIQFAIRIIVAC